LSVTSNFGEALLLEKLAHQPQRGPAVAAALQQHVEDLALVVDGAPQIHPPAGDPNHHLVEMPSVARPLPALSQLARDHRTKFQHPTTYRFVGDVEPTLSICELWPLPRAESAGEHPRSSRPCGPPAVVDLISR
jgi:hypothetical protein